MKQEVHSFLVTPPLRYRSTEREREVPGYKRHYPGNKEKLGTRHN